MVNTLEIQIFVSNPGDVNDEKEIVEDVCKEMNDSLEQENCSVRYFVKEWSKVVGKIGLNPQLQIESRIREYDIYIGIWWHRFGSDTGIINSQTGKDYGSGTLREFREAELHFNQNNTPDIHVFFKKELSKELNKSDVLQQFQLVLELENELKKNKNWCNPFETKEDFRQTITNLLWRKALKKCLERQVIEKQTILTTTSTNLSGFAPISIEIPNNYIDRTSYHYSETTSVIYIPELVNDRKSLDQVALEKKRVILLGDAGSGKSTELNNLFRKLSQKESSVIPILQKFRHYTPERGLEEFLPKGWKDIPQNLLFILWDGLDEIQPQHFNTVIRQIAIFSENHPSVKILVSCRTNFYELPINGSEGTLPGFEPYFISDLTLEDAREYFNSENISATINDFLTEVNRAKVSDLITKPFFLMLLADTFNREGMLSLKRGEIYEMFLLERINFDQAHYKTTIDLKKKKRQILVLLQRVALGMELMSKNQINEPEILDIINEKEFNLLRYCTAFKKQEGKDDIWQFEHNNIQEYLAAKVLSNLEFRVVLKFITIPSLSNKLNPSWVNTLAFLFSILDTESLLYKDLLSWLLANEKETIVKFEPDKVTIETRVQIFQGIFNYYKGHDVWLSSNKFTELDLAEFGQSDENFKFLLNEIEDESSTKTARINAVRLLRYFVVKTPQDRSQATDILLKALQNNLSDPNYIHSIIYALIGIGTIDKQTTDQLMKLVGNRSNEFIRAAMYKNLQSWNGSNEYVDYLIGGLELIDSKIKDDRGSTTLMDEQWNLDECIRAINSPVGIKKLIAFVTANRSFLDRYRGIENLQAIMNNAVDAFERDDNVFQSVLQLFSSELRFFRMETSKVLVSFFDKTNTRERAFKEIWQSEDDKGKNKGLVLARLANAPLLAFVVEQYNGRNLTNEQLLRFYHDLRWSGRTEVVVEFEKLIQERTDFQLPKIAWIDYEAIRKEKMKIDFSLLFDKDQFREKTLEVFEKEEKEELSFDELYEIRSDNYAEPSLEDRYSNISIGLLRDFVSQGETVSKSRVINWFEKPANVEWYRVDQIYEHLTNHKELEVDEKKRKWIEDWCNRSLARFDFKTAIEVREDNGLSYSTIAAYVWYFTKTLEIVLPSNALLDMLSFAMFEGNGWSEIEHIVSRLDSADIVKRMMENLATGIPVDQVLNNHIQFLTENRITEAYPFILKEILNIKRNAYQRISFLNTFVKNTLDLESLKNIIGYADSEIEWAIVDRLKEHNETGFLLEYLKKKISRVVSSPDRFKTASVLVTLGDIQGLEMFTQILIDRVEAGMEISDTNCLYSVKSIAAIPSLIRLLDLTYNREIKIDRFVPFESEILQVFNNIGLVNEENFLAVKSSLQQFKDDRPHIKEKVKYLVVFIERLEAQYFMNLAKTVTMKEVKERLKLLKGFES